MCWAGLSAHVGKEKKSACSFSPVRDPGLWSEGATHDEDNNCFGALNLSHELHTVQITPSFPQRSGGVRDEAIELGKHAPRCPLLFLRWESDCVAQAVSERRCSAVILGRGAAASQAQAEPWDLEIITGWSVQHRPLMVHWQEAGCCTWDTQS